MTERDIRIDILRGLAIFTMVAANMSAHSLLPPHDFLFRLYGSIAAPLFIFLSGMMVSHTTQAKSHPLSYYLLRCLSVLVIASLIDLFIWEILPFSTFDVLYLIAVAMPVIYLVNKLPATLHILLVLVSFALPPILQFYLSYQDYPVEIYYLEQPASDYVNVPVFHQFFVDGWFPFFPWIGISLAGALIGRLKAVENLPYRFWKRLTAVALLASGITVWITQNPELIEREGYSELFYPPTIGYILTMVGGIILLLELIYAIPVFPKLNFLSTFGKSSMLVYILHSVFIVAIFYGFEPVGLAEFTGLYLLHAAVLWVICFGVQRLIAGKKLPFFAKLILGG